MEKKRLRGYKLFSGLNNLDYQLTQQLMIDTRLRGDDKPFNKVSPAQAGGKREKGDSGSFFNLLY